MVVSPDRPHLPRPVERELLVEAGHRCAIPTCRRTPVEIAHIVARAKGGPDTVDNLIVLCPNCHTRYDRGEIDRPAMFQYKANLFVINGRYGDVERRILAHFVDDQGSGTTWLPGGSDIQVEYLLHDGFLEKTGRDSGVYIASVPSQEEYRLTDAGRRFITSWSTAEPLA